MYPPGGNADLFENEWLAGKAIRKTMKTKGRQNRKVGCQKSIAALGSYPTPGVLQEEFGFD
jgi:hypothetical protein